MDNKSDLVYPKIITFLASTGFGVAIILLTLCLVIFYNISYFLYVPPTGVWLDYENENRNSAIIFSIAPGSPGEKAGLNVGDRIITIDGREITNLNVPVHLPKKAGDVETYVIQRSEQILTIPLHVGRLTDHLDYLANIIPIQMLSLIFYSLGVILLLFSPATDIKARLIALVWILAGVVIAATGPGYTSCAWFAPDVAMISLALLIFTCPTAHLYFPAATFSSRIRNYLIWVLVGFSVVLISTYLAQQIYFATQGLNPLTSITRKAINYPFYLSLLVTIVLLIRNRYFIKDKEIKRQTGIILLGMLLGLLPLLLFSELPYLIFGPESDFILLPTNISVLSLIFLPISYGYVIYQRKLLKIDVIINRGLVLLLFIFTIFFVSLTILVVISSLVNLPAQVAIVGSVLCIFVALLSASWHNKIQVQVDRVLYGGYYDYGTVTSDLSNRLAQTNDRPTYIKLLTNVLPDKMKIEKSALLLRTDNRLELQMPGDQIYSVSQNDEIHKLMSRAEGPVRAQNIWNSVSSDTIKQWNLFSWVQLFVPIFHQETLYGVLLLGDRVTGNIYSNQDLQIIGTVGQQAALSIANISLVEALRGLTQQLVRSDEEQRKKVARELHDTVLQNLFFIKQRLARSDPEAAVSVDQTITMLRQIIKAQRPSLLDRGLTLALQDLINDMEQLAADDIVILWHNGLDSEIVLTDEKATSIYRIVQESLVNVLKHAHADQVIVTARRDNDVLVLQIEDDGIGISKESLTQIGYHYGLLGMIERATMIGATLSIVTEPGKGCTVTVMVKLKNSVN